MTTTTQMRAQRLADHFGRRIALRLSEGEARLPHDIGERLRVARQRAVAARKHPALEPVAQLAWAGAFPAQGDRHARLHRIASAIPLLLLAVGLVAISVQQADRRASELAEVDAALLTDPLPPSAYTDPGFVEFLKSER